MMALHIKWSLKVEACTGVPQSSQDGTRAEVIWHKATSLSSYLWCHVMACHERHLRFDVPRNSAIQSADPENPILEPKLEDSLPLPCHSRQQKRIRGYGGSRTGQMYRSFLRVKCRYASKTSMYAYCQLIHCWSDQFMNKKLNINNNKQ